MSRFPLLFVALAIMPIEAASGQPAPAPAAKAAPEAAAPAPEAAPAAAPAAVAPLAAVVDAQGFADAADKDAYSRMMVRVQVLLDRRHFSPGVIDGRGGTNVARAVKAFQQSAGLSATGTLDAATFAKLVASDGAPVIRTYTITDSDVAGPFAGPVEPGDYVGMAKRPDMGWQTPLESIAERAHMAEPLVRAMNPGADFARAGTVLILADTARPDLATVAAITIDKGRRELRAMDAAGKVLAVYPATVGSSERPAPSGKWAVRTVAPAPSYTFDPGRLTFKAKGAAAGQKLTIQPGPNNPVGSTWIDLTRDTYGIHGTPHPEDIGKAESHGCVRLTNWDAKELAGAVKAGTSVVFTGRAGR
jgi:lipoprotein-anchoring transpeptidase ErfK/SrfK